MINKKSYRDGKIFFLYGGLISYCRIRYLSYSKIWTSYRSPTRDSRIISLIRKCSRIQITYINLYRIITSSWSQYYSFCLYHIICNLARIKDEIICRYTCIKCNNRVWCSTRHCSYICSWLILLIRCFYDLITAYRSEIS